jgi:type II secretory pathway pseudopilin PulG
MNNFKHYSKGLILIEVAIAMIIFSLCIGTVLMVIQHSQHTQQSQTTLTHRKMIIHALNRYHRQEGRIPCPSQPISDDGFAIDRCTIPTEQIGLIPYKTLGLPAYVSKDGYGHFFTYAVSENATCPLGKNVNAAVQQGKEGEIIETPVRDSKIIVLDKQGREYTQGKEGIAYVLISHGAKGNGAFSLQPDRKRFPTRTVFEAENARDTLMFYVDIPVKDSDHDVFFIQRADLDILPTFSKPGTTESNPYEGT